ncbi:MAG: transcriptional regulator [Thaumarchaeota archaeon]|nr:transcriptional regulator [Nitrososphaerota archaeon]
MKNEEPSLEELFMELASNTRRSMLQKLDEHDFKLSKLASDLELTIQEAHRNVLRLSKLGLVEKTLDNSFAISSFGKFIINQLGPFEFLLQNEDYFKKHTAGDLPTKFIERLGALKNATLVCGIGPVLERWKKMGKEAKSGIKSITIHYPLDVIAIFAAKPKEGVELSYIFGQNTEVPKARDEMLKKIGWTKLISSGIVKRKMLKTIQVSVTVTDKESCVFFPDLKGQTDMLSGFFSNDDQFSEWCNDFFNYQWERADFFDESKLHKN